MSQRSDLDVLRAYADDKRPTTNPEVIDALDRAVAFLDKMRDEAKRETATLTGIEDLLRTTEAAIEEGNDDPPDQATAMATVGVLGAIAHVATNLAASADRLASIDASLRTIARAHEPQLIVARAQPETEPEPEDGFDRVVRAQRGKENMERADLVVAPSTPTTPAIVWKSRSKRYVRGAVFDVNSVLPGTVVYFASEGDIA